MTVADRNGEAFRRIRNGLGRRDTDRVEPFGPGKLLDQPTQCGGAQKSRFA